MMHLSHVSDGVCMDSDKLDDNFLKRSTLGVYGRFLHGVERVHAVNDFAKDCVYIIEVRLLGVRDEELLLVGIGAAVRHRHDASAIVPILRMKFIVKSPTPNTFTAFASTRGVTSLHHKSLHVTMKYSTIVRATRAEGQKIFSCARRRVATDFNLDNAQACVQTDGLSFHECMR